MLVRVRPKGDRARILAVVGALALVAGCGDDDDGSDGTLPVIDGTASVPAATVPTRATGAGPGTTVAPDDAGSGVVSISVQVAAAGIAETISLDRSTVAATSLDPVTLDASCTPLDGGDLSAGVEVSIVDLRRLAGEKVVSAVLRYGDGAPGEHEMTLELGGADQVTTTYAGTVTVDDSGLSGAFEGEDAGGTPVTGSFACASEAIATTTLPQLDAGEVVPEDAAASTTAAATAPAVTTTTP